MSCECGRSWVAIEHPNPGSMHNLWRPESRFARWRRERRARRLDERNKPSTEEGS